ncbi:hypothetical protein JW968_02705 [Candidatus Woesearchaeota archaeon]|nr:hypothetical protein [Candidatus Woesearchaeota archaeon]
MAIFVMIEGMDLAGKGLILDSIKDFFKERGNAVFDAREFESRNSRIPLKDDFITYDVIVSAEPTFAMVGKAIRDEIVRRNSRDYGALSTAMAFSLDREMLYNCMVIPALQAGKMIIQERGLPSSLVYQPVQGDGMDMQDILKLPGNKLALKNPPDILIILVAEPDVVVGRIGVRKKQDKAIFENLDFQAMIKKRYQSLWIKDLFEKAGTKVFYIDTTSIRPEETAVRALEILKQNLEKK